MSSEDRLHAYSRRRRTARVPGQRRYRHTTVVTTRGEEEPVRNMGQVISSRRQSVDDVNFVHSNEAILLPKDRECCFSRLKTRKESIKRTIMVFLLAFGILKMVCGMIFVAIHVVVTFSSPDAADDLQNPLPVYLSAVTVAISGLCDIVLSKIRSPYMILTGMFFSISSCVVTLAGLLSTASVSLPKFNSFIQFKFDPVLQACTAYTRWDIMPNGTFIGGVTFYNVSGCSLIESTLTPLITSLVAFYGISCITSFIVCLLLAITLCLPEKNRKLERLRRASASSYINYDLNLDHICDSWQPEPRMNLNRSTVRKSNSDGSAYLPGVAIPYYTIPYRIPLVQCKSSRGINGRSSSLEFGRFDADTSRCNCSNSVGDPVLRRIRSRESSSTSTSGVEFHRSNHRPVIPIEFRCIGIPSRDVRPPRTKPHSRSRPLQLPEEPRTTSATGRRSRGAIIESINANKRCEQHSSTDNDSCPPPYSELPSHERVSECDDSIGKSCRCADHDETIL